METPSSHTRTFSATSVSRRAVALRRCSAHLVAVCLAPMLSYAAEPDANVLQARARVAAMAEQSLDLIESEVALTGVEGWAVFSGDRLPPSLGRGVGMAEDFNGETYFLIARADGCLSRDYRHVLVFRDRGAFESFRKGELQGEALERLRRRSSRDDVMAFRFRPTEQPELEPLDLSGCRFALHKDLQRALVAEPSRTEGMVEDKAVDVDDN